MARKTNASRRKALQKKKKSGGPSGFRRNFEGELVPSRPSKIPKVKRKTIGEKKAEQFRLALKAYRQRERLKSNASENEGSKS